MLHIKHGRNVCDALTLAEGAVAFNVAGHSVDDVGDGFTGVRVVDVVVEHGVMVDGTVRSKGVETFVPVDMTDRHTVRRGTEKGARGEGGGLP